MCPTSCLYITTLRVRPSLLGRCDRDLVKVHCVFKDQLVEGFPPESGLCGGVPHSLGVRPRAVETRKVTGPEEVAETDFGNSAETAFFPDLEGEKALPLHKFARLVGERDVGLEDPVGGLAEFVFPVKSPEHERHPTDTRLFEDKTHFRMAIATSREDN